MKLPILPIYRWQLEELPEYSCTVPDGVYIGKVWARRELYEATDEASKWYLGVYVPCDKPDHCEILWIECKVYEEADVPRLAAQVMKELERRHGEGYSIVHAEAAKLFVLVEGSLLPGKLWTSVLADLGIPPCQALTTMVVGELCRRGRAA